MSPDMHVDDPTEALMRELFARCDATPDVELAERAAQQAGRRRAVKLSAVVVGVVAVGAAVALAGGTGTSTVPPLSTTASSNPVGASPLTCRNFQIFSVSLAKDGGGAATPLDAASDAATTGGFGWDLPADGWVVIASADTNASEVGLRSGDVELHAFRASDGTWLIDSGKRCS